MGNKLPSAEELAEHLVHLECEHTMEGHCEECALRHLKEHRNAVLEAAAEQYVERQEQRWRKFFEPNKSDSARQAFAMMMQGVRCEADEIRKLKAQP